MKRYTYDLTTGIFTGTWQSAQMAPPGMGIYEPVGPFDPHSSRMVDGKIVDYQPPKPDDTVHTAYEWEPTAKQWIGYPTEARLALAVRADRDRRLAACDWVVIRAQDYGTPIDVKWREYRNALRDVTKQPGFPRAIDWPIAPE